MKMIIWKNLCRALKQKWPVATAGLAGGIVLFTAVSARETQAENPQRGNPLTLAGTWEQQVGAAPGPVFNAVETFTESGGSIEINNGPGGPTTAIGTWMRTGPRNFLTKHIKHVFSGTGQHEVTVKVRRSITLSQNGLEFSGRDNVELFDPAGNKLPVQIPSAPFHGRRLAPEPLSW